MRYLAILLFAVAFGGCASTPPPWHGGFLDSLSDYYDQGTGGGRSIERADRNAQIALLGFQQGIDIELPKTQSEGLKSPSEALVVTVKRDGQIFVQSSEVPMQELEAKLDSIFAARGDWEVFLRADAQVAYGTVARTLAILRRAGASRIGMVTEPEV